MPELDDIDFDHVNVDKVVDEIVNKIFPANRFLAVVAKPFVRVYLALTLRIFHAKKSRQQDGMGRTRTHRVGDGQRASISAASGENLSPIRSYMEQAHAYEDQIHWLADSAETEMSRFRLEELARRVTSWRERLDELRVRVNGWQHNPLIRQDLKAVPQSITTLEKRLDKATDARIRAELERTLESRREQWSALENLENTLQWAEIKIENTVSLLGIIYTQALLGQSKGEVIDYRRLLEDVEEEAQSLDDYVTTLDEVKLGEHLNLSDAALAVSPHRGLE